MPDVVEALDHGLELAHRLAGGGVADVRREEADGVVAPVVGEPALHQVAVGDVLVHRQQLDRRDAQVGEVVEGCRRAEPGVRPAQLLGHLRVQLGEALDVDLVDQRAIERDVELGVTAPHEGVVDHDALRHEVGRVAFIGLIVVGADAIAEERVVPRHLAVDALGVGVDQQLGRVEPMAGGRVVAAVHPIAVALAGSHVGQVAVPHEIGLLDQTDALLVAPVGVVQAQVDVLRVLAEDREVDPRPIPGRAERVGPAAPDPQRHVTSGAARWAGLEVHSHRCRVLSARRRCWVAGRCRRHRPARAMRSSAARGSQSQSGRLLAS